jgi:hypothetical protein
MNIALNVSCHIRGTVLWLGEGLQPLLDQRTVPSLVGINCSYSANHGG